MIKETLFKLSTKITGKKLISDNCVYQNINEIHYEDYHFVIHEACHYLAANNKNRMIDNLGFPRFEDPNQGQFYHLLSEIKTIYFTNRIFGDWLNKFDDSSKEIAYLCYLCDYLNKPMLKEFGISNLDINTDIWDIQLDRKLNKLGLSLEELKLELYEKQFQ